MNHSHQAPNEVSIDRDVTMLQVLRIGAYFQDSQKDDINCLCGKAEGLSCQSDGILANSSMSQVLVSFQIVVPFLPIEQYQIADQFQKHDHFTKVQSNFVHFISYSNGFFFD